jgi:uncharacterized repeat protein (TIGR02543 family)
MFFAKRRNGAVACVLAVLLVAGVLSAAGPAYAEGGATGVTAVFGVHGEFTVESSGTLNGVSCEGNVLTITNADDVVTVSNTDGGAKVIEGNILLSPGDDATARLTLRGVRLKGVLSRAGAVELSSGIAEVSLEGRSELISDNGNAAFQTRIGTKLIIKSDAGGSLKATALGNGAGIGAGSWNRAGDIVIESGAVEAVSGTGGAGIGAGFSTASGDIAVHGGTVRATGGDMGAGVGGGYKASSGDITITGGEVVASVTGYYGSAIGGGVSGAGAGDIVISGGDVTAKAAEYGGAAIGGGANDSGAGSILISGGNVAATGYESAGIGSGGFSESQGVTITGGNVTATGYGNIGIGSGESPDAQSVVIDGGNVSAGGVKPAPVSRSGQAVYENELTFIRDVSGLPVSAGAIDEIPCYAGEPTRDGDYGIKDVSVNNENSVRFYLPAANGDAAGVALTVGEDLFGANYVREGNGTHDLRLIMDVGAPGPFDAVYGQMLSGISLPGGWAFTEDGGATVGPAGEMKHPAVFTPEDTDYAPVTKSVTIHVAKKDPNVRPPDDATAVYGQTLGAITLADGWSWDEGDAAPVGDAGERSHTATYTPSDTANYNTQHQRVRVTVAKKDPDVSPPGDFTAVYGQMLGEFALEDGWTWDEGDAAPVGDAGERSHPATYTPPDTANYNTQSQSVRLTVKKYTPKTEPPPTLSTFDDKALGDLALPDGWTWDEGAGAPVGSAGARPRSVSYIPEDAANWESLYGTVLVIVNESEDEYAKGTEDENGPDAERTIRFIGADRTVVRTIAVGKKIGRLPKVARKGYVFAGWHTAKKGGRRIAPSYKVTEKTPDSLYAHWKKAATYGKVTRCSALFVRKYPSPHSNLSAVAGYVKAGKKLKILKKEGNWYRVAFGKREMYVWTHYVRIMK